MATWQNQSSSRLALRYEPLQDLEERYPEWDLLDVPMGPRQKKLIVWATQTAYVDTELFILDPEYVVANVVGHLDAFDQGIPEEHRDSYAHDFAIVQLDRPGTRPL